MICVFDANFMLMLFDPRARVPQRAGQPPVANAKERIESLVVDLSKGGKTKIIVPTPALAEFLLMAPDSCSDYITEIKRRSVFEIVGFDESACIELVEFSQVLGKPTRKFSKDPNETKAKIKYDRQIIAISKASRATTIYTTDDGVADLARSLGIEAIDLGDLAPPPARQVMLFAPTPPPPTIAAEGTEVSPQSPAQLAPLSTAPKDEK